MNVQAAGEQVLTISMVDLAGYTALTETHGDIHAADLAELLASLATESLESGDRMIKTIGDAVLLTSQTPGAGIALVTRILVSLAHRDDVPLTRAGIHHGDVVERNGDVFGSTVNVTARIAGHAASGQVLATPYVADAARALGIAVRSVPPATLKNLSDNYDLYDLALSPERSEGSVDPVCRMWVDRSKAVGPTAFRGTTFWFCSNSCQERFRAIPERFGQ